MAALICFRISSKWLQVILVLLTTDLLTSNRVNVSLKILYRCAAIHTMIEIHHVAHASSLGNAAPGRLRYLFRGAAPQKFLIDISLEDQMRIETPGCG